ncbi:MAG: EAL domain-containing protein [Pseudanabaenaceae cyanobacterium SKYGB_i_bin29]|nr:EAL domain-containing protein [Pseudanabaenaceae cyanobacterium SKYG29]MDW8420656.1 EAL domain-containing protein [Pseudanabaenaceae cyanobacterium SKYGB_i_bin29]
MSKFSPAKILIVDDMPDNVRLLTNILSRKGFELIAAYSAQMALQLLQSVLPDLILLDVNMPGMSGYELCETLKLDDRLKSIPIIFISALNDIQDVVHGFSLGAVDYITKPFQIEEVIARVNTHISLYRLQRQLLVENQTLQTKIQERFNIDRDLYNDLCQAIPNQELEIYYQPIVSIADNKISGFEALLRWQHPTRGKVSPGEFIPIAEQTGLINNMGAWVAQRSMLQLSRWHSAYPQLMVSINVAGSQLLDPQFINVIENGLSITGVSPSQIKLEITESDIITDVDRAINQLQQLRELGVKVCLDDFGIGYSSLSRVQEFPIDVIKIDRTFIKQKNWVIANIIQLLADSLGVEVIAEGIETVEQLTKVRGIGCDYGQGFLFSPPLPVKEATDLLAQVFLPG